MTVITAFTYINITSLQFKRSIRFNTCNGWNIRLIRNVGINSTSPPIKTTTIETIKNCTGFPSSQRCLFPFTNGSSTFIRAGASASSFSSNDPCFAVLIKVINHHKTPIKYKPPPIALIIYIGIICNNCFKEIWIL